MKAWHIDDANNKLVLKEGALNPQEGEVQVKISKVAMTSAGINCFKGRDDENVTVPAHSAIAYMTADNEELGLRLGSRVAVCPFIKTVEHGVNAVKTMGVNINGLLTDFVYVPIENIFALPDGIPDEDAVFADYIAIGNKVFNELSYNYGDYVAIVGAGTLGLVLCQMAMYYQLVPILVDLDEDKLELAKKRGVYYTLNPTYDNLDRRVIEITGGRLCDSAIFTSEGVGLSAALRLVKNESDVIVAGYPTYNKNNVNVEMVFRKGLRLKGVSDGAGEMPSAINLLANSVVHMNGIITARHYFDEVGKIYEDCVQYPYKYNAVLFTVD
ncbi:MAG: zinc-binding dehydrogenase [Bacteroides sp.]|nr:zinc-binding dehydrogenase [Bacillota bacterium]MCM1393581.1 zinc-binding dehydrogenase [[Eubacterium] siraeum]MCM1455000.1 zinc-binding dehydrogenase [Bacteroides sp.]